MTYFFCPRNIMKKVKLQYFGLKTQVLGWIRCKSIPYHQELLPLLFLVVHHVTIIKRLEWNSIDEESVEEEENFLGKTSEQLYSKRELHESKDFTRISCSLNIMNSTTYFTLKSGFVSGYNYQSFTSTH